VILELFHFSSGDFWTPLTSSKFRSWLETSCKAMVDCEVALPEKDPERFGMVSSLAGISFLISKNRTIVHPSRLVRDTVKRFSSGALPTVCDPRQHSTKLPQIPGKEIFDAHLVD